MVWLSSSNNFRTNSNRRFWHIASSVQQNPSHASSIAASSAQIAANLVAAAPAVVSKLVAPKAGDTAAGLPGEVSRILEKKASKAIEEVVRRFAKASKKAAVRKAGTELFSRGADSLEYKRHQTLQG